VDEELGARIECHFETFVRRVSAWSSAVYQSIERSERT
jgi:hypothetical protein